MNISTELNRKILEYESGEMSNEQDILDFFQELVNTGLAWELQGQYGRTAMNLLNGGLIELASNTITR